MAKKKLKFGGERIAPGSPLSKMVEETVDMADLVKPRMRLLAKRAQHIEKVLGIRR